jgi:hypothetical protein
MKHIGVFGPKLMEKVLSCEKRVDIRLSQKAIAPYQQISRGDLILVKLSGGKVYGEARVENVLFYDRLNQNKLNRLKERYQRKSQTDDRFWRQSKRANYATVIFLTGIKRYLSPIVINKKDRSGWKVIKN